MASPTRRQPSFFAVLRQSNSRRRTPSENRRDLQAIVAVLMVGAGMVLGGGGTTNPATEVVLEVLAAMLMLGWSLIPQAPERPLSRWPHARWQLAIAALVLILPLVQLVPLPPSIWHALPGRGAEIASLSLVAQREAWMPWSVAPPQTLALLLALIPPLAMMWFVAALDNRGRTLVIRTIVLVALASVALGALQVAAPPGRAPTFYDYYHGGFVIGFQANKNAEVDVLLIGLLGTAALFAPLAARARRVGTGNAGSVLSSATIAFAVVSLVFLVGAVLTGSRGGILLIPATCLGALAIIGTRRKMARKGLAAIAASAIATLGLTAIALRNNAVLGKVFARFSAERDFRAELWTDTLYAARQVWPFGSGMGTFVQMMTPAERLEVLDQTVPVRAHNDYLELLLETGIFGPILIVLLTILLVTMATKAWTSQTVERNHIAFAVATFLVIAVHSLVDYPMRSMSLAILSGVAAGLLAPVVSRLSMPSPQASGPA